MPAVALAAVEPGIYFDPERAAVGDRVTLFSAADYIVCFSPGAEQGLEERPVHLGPARIVDPGVDDLVQVRGTWSESDGALFFSFTVPEIEGGSYRGYIECADGRLDPSTKVLVVEPSPPASDTVPTGGDAWVGPGWLLAVAAGLGFVFALRRLSTARHGPRLAHAARVRRT